MIRTTPEAGTYYGYLHSETDPKRPMLAKVTVQEDGSTAVVPAASPQRSESRGSFRYGWDRGVLQANIVGGALGAVVMPFTSAAEMAPLFSALCALGVWGYMRGKK